MVRFLRVVPQVQHVAEYRDTISRLRCKGMQCGQTRDDRGGTGVMGVIQQVGMTYSWQWIEPPWHWLDLCYRPGCLLRAQAAVRGNAECRQHGRKMMCS